MKPHYGVIGLLILGLYSCQRPSSYQFTILDGSNFKTIVSSQNSPRLLLQQAGLVLGEGDRILLNGTEIPPDEVTTESANPTLQIRHPVPLTIQSPGESKVIQTSALTVGEALAESGMDLFTSDFVDPPSSTAITGPLIVVVVPSRQVRVFYGNNPIVLHSAEGTIGRALAKAGIPLVGLDYSFPSENEAPPADGQLRVVRVHESVDLAMKSTPYESEYVVSDKVELDQTEILQPGSDGLTISRTRTHFEDGRQTWRQVEGELVVRPPQKSVVGYGTKIVTHKISGTNLEYWRAIQMYATSYSPCRSGVSSCLSGTSLGLPVKKGVVAMKYDWYNQLQGQQLYIPGYGLAVVADVGGGYPDGRPWIDLGYSDSDWQEWGDWVTVYFLTPVPDNIPYILK